MEARKKWYEFIPLLAAAVALGLTVWSAPWNAGREYESLTSAITRLEAGMAQYQQNTAVLLSKSADVERWIENHESVNTERRTTITAQLTSLAASLTALTENVNKLTAKVEQIDYRVTQGETRDQRTDQVIDTTRSTLGELMANDRLTKAQLDRIEVILNDPSPRGSQKEDIGVR